jgi:DNA-binding transcriptional ArsR family regulator
MSEAELQTLLSFFKVLADESRLKMLGILATQERSVEELAELLQLKTPTVSHHLAKMKALGLVTMRAEGNTHLYALRPEGLRDLSKDLLTQEKVASLAKDVEGEAWERKVLKDFFEGEKLKEIPASRKKREVVLRWLAGRFEPAVRYKEPQVNEIISRHHPDFATLRRELIGANLLAREAGVYWRL